MNINRKISLAGKLRLEGHTYKSIATILSCSLSSVYGYINKEVGFRNVESSKLRYKEMTLPNKIYEFHRRGVLRAEGVRVSRKSETSVKGKVKSSFTSEDLIRKGGTTCYLTGREIVMTDGSSYQLDHIIPASSGGTSILDNCGIACKQANWAKGDMTLEDFFQLCLDVVRYNKLE
jgi:5-methylcytosine-specific restriction endonuclease McrA